MTLWVALVVLVAFSAFFSASETAFSSLNQIRLKSRAEDGDASAARVLAMAEKYDKLLSTILIGNNIVNIAAASIGTIIFTKMLGAERGATVSTMVLTVVVLIFGEVTPKSLAKEMPETVATAVAPALSLLMLVFTPLTWLFSQWKRFLGHFVHSTEEDTITEGELMTMVSEAENDGELTDRESELIRSAIEFDDVEVEEILTPRVDVIAVEDDLPLEEVEIETPITMAKTKVLAGRKLALVPILRAGMGMLDGMLTLLPAAKVGFIGLYRDEKTLQPVEYFCKLPQDIAERDVLVLDPMLATGGSAIDAITQIKKHGAKRIKFIGLLGAPEGIKALHEAHPDVDIYLGAQDDRLNENGYIVPGLGDAGDRIFGTK